MDLEMIVLSEIRQTEKDKYHMISLICGIQKIVQVNLLIKEKQTHKHRKQTYGYQRGRVEGEINWKYGIYRCTLPYIK